MLHLAIIGIACAVSALNEGIAFIERKNNEFNTFCLSEEGKQNIAKASFPRFYDVDVHNFSDCGGNRIVNRTSSFFYDYITNRYQSGRNNSCNIMENVSLKKLKNFESEADFAFKKRKLLWEKRKSTLRLSMKNERSQNKENKLKLKKCKRKEPKSEQLKKKKNQSGLSHKEKRLFLRLKNFKNSLSSPFNKDSSLDAERRIEKFCKKMQQENQLEEGKILHADTTVCRRKFKGFEKTLPKSSVFYNNNLHDIFSLRKNSFRNKHHISDSNSDLISVNPVSGNSDYISIHDTPKTIFETLPNFQSRKNCPYFHSDIRDLKPTYKKNLFDKPYPHSASFKSKLNFLHSKSKFVPEKKIKRNDKTRLATGKSKQRMKNWPFSKNLARQRSYKMRQKRREKLTINENNNASSSSHSDILRKKEITNESGKAEDIITEAAPVLKPTQKYEEDLLPSPAIEKPFLNHGYQSQMQESSHKIPGNYYNSQTDSPLFSSTYNHFCQKYSDQISSNFPFSHKKVRHALRKCLTNHILKNRNKRCGMTLCSAPRKCWRSAPLLCIPYIKKGQEDILKYLIQIMEKMLGKPCPPRKDIFERTKYKPDKKLICDSSCDDSYDDYEFENTISSVQSTPYPPNESTKSPTGSSTKHNNSPHITSSIRPSIGRNAEPNFGSNMRPAFESDMAIGLPSFPSNEPTISQSVGLSNKACLATTVKPNNEQCICKIPQTTPKTQRKSGLVGSPDCTPLSNFPINSNIANSHLDDPAHFVIPPLLPLNNTWLRTAPGSEEIATKNLNRLSDQPLLNPSSISSTAEPTDTFFPNDLASSSNEIEDFMNKNTDNANSSATLYSTESFIPEVTESSRFDEPCFSTINPDSLNFTNFPIKYADHFSISPQTYTTTTEYSMAQPYQDSELGASIPSYYAQPEYSITKPNQDLEITTIPSYNLLNDYFKVQPYQNFELPDSASLNQNIKMPYPSEKPQPNNFDLNNEDFGNVPSIIQDMPKWISKTTESSSATTTETSLKHNKLKKKEKCHKHGSSKYSKNKKEHFKEYLLDENHTPNPINLTDSNFFFARKKKGRVHQKKLFKKNLHKQKKGLISPFDYNSYDTYPLINSNSNNKKSHKKHSKRARKNHSHRKKYLKVKNFKNQNSLARLKREDDYIWPEIYSNYQDESIYEDKNIKKRPESSTATSDENPPDQDWTPPFYDMFSELAKAVSGSTSTESEPEKIMTSEHSNIATNATDATITTTPNATSGTFATTTVKPASAVTSIKSITNTTGTADTKGTSANTLTSDTSASMTASTIVFTNAATSILPKATTVTTPNKAIAANITNFLVNGSTKTNSFIGVRFSTAAPKNNSNATIILKTTAPPTYKRVIIQTNTSHFIGGTGAVVDGFGFTAANVANKAIFNTSAINSAIITTENTPTAIIFSTNSEVYKSKNFAVASENQKTAIQNEKILSENEKPFTKYVRSNLSLPHNEKKNFSLAVNSSHPFKIRVDSIIGSKYGGKLLKGRGMDNVKTGKKGFFQTNFKGNSSNSESSAEKNSKKDSGKEEKTGKGNQDSDMGDGQAPTTLKAAVIVKGSKKMLTKPSPKVFSRIYPDSFNFEIEANDTVTTTMTTTNSSIENKTALLSSTLKPDIRLQLLAVCDGYLEIIKRIKALNQTFGEKMDADLAQYCESIISQSFNSQSEKPKKLESSESSLKNNYVNAVEETENNKEFSDSQIQEKSTDDIIIHSASEKKNENDEIKKTIKNLKEGKNLTEADSMENPDSEKKKKKKRKKFCKKSLKKKKTDQKNDQKEEGSLKKGITEEQVKLIELLKKRKRALMSWLINSKDQPDDSPETEYLDDEDFISPDSEFSEYSGTIKPKRNDNIFKRTTESLYPANKVYPIYAKHYGYDKEGELREIEVLWREVNEKTHEQKILKNISVIAFLMTSTSSPNQYQEETKPLGAKEYEEDLVDTELKKSNKVGFASEISDILDKTTPSETENLEIKAIRSSDSTTVTPKPSKKNGTHIFISKPDPSLIVGTPPNKNKTHQNTTRKVSHKYDVAKDFFQEYSIEFLNYAVYILPAMFTILFFFCCFGCALYILKTRKSFKKGKKKKKIDFTSDETTETSEEFEDSRAKRKRENKRKKKAYKSGAEDANSEKKTKKKFWNVLKMPASSSKELNEDNTQNERKSFLKFLKGRKEDNKAVNNKFSKNYPDSDQSDQYVATSTEDKKETYKGDANSEAVERRELISLLEELKKIELEQTGEKKEVKSVQVQYAIQEDENPFCKRSEFSYPYEKNVFGFPKGYFFCSKKFPGQQTDKPLIKGWDLYGDVSEMTELLPCECNYYPDKKDYFRHFRLNQEGECKHLYKIYRDSGVNKKPFEVKNFMSNEGEKNKSYIYNKHRTTNSDSSEEFLGVNKKNVGTEVRLTENSSPVRLLLKNNTGLIEKMENMKHHLNKKKYVRLKDDGVLCRL